MRKSATLRAGIWNSEYTSIREDAQAQVVYTDTTRDRILWLLQMATNNRQLERITLLCEFLRARMRLAITKETEWI